MKRRILFLVMLTLTLSVLTGCCLSHEWQDATCETPRTCAKCEEVEGEALGHTWEPATCERLDTCSACGKTKGRLKDHKWEDATCETPKTCSVCGETKGDALGHKWEDPTCEAPKTCSVCAATEGDLGHDLYRGKVEEADDGKITYAAECSNCGAKDLKKTYANADAMVAEWAQGIWLPLYYLSGEDLYYFPDNMKGDYFQFGEGHSVKFVFQGNKEENEWTFSETVSGNDYDFLVCKLPTSLGELIFCFDNPSMLYWRTAKEIFFYTQDAQ